MTKPLAIGVGCRLGATVEAIDSLIRQALERAPSACRLGLFTIQEKAKEPGLIEAAKRLRLNLIPLAREALHAQGRYVQTRSVRAESRFGVVSVAEAAALAGAGAHAVLVVPRIASDGVTCAIARAGDVPA